MVVTILATLVWWREHGRFMAHCAGEQVYMPMQAAAFWLKQGVVRPSEQKRKKDDDSYSRT